MSRLALRAALAPLAEKDMEFTVEHPMAGAPVDSWNVSGKGFTRARLDEAHALGLITDEELAQGLSLIESRPW